MVQAIAYFELSKPSIDNKVLHHEALIKAAIEDAKSQLHQLQGSLPFEELVVEALVSVLLSSYTHVADSI